MTENYCTIKRIPIDQTSNNVILKPGFQNRRNRSAHLKNSFPGGFKTIRSLPSLDHIPSLHESTTMHSSSGSQLKLQKKSYMSWTQGGSNSIEYNDDLESSHNSVLIDPLAAMAGPYYSDLMRAKMNDASKYRNTYDPKSLICSVESHEIFLQEKSKIDKAEEVKKFRASHLTLHDKIYHAPTSLPACTSKLNNNKLQMSTPQYEAWLESVRTNNNEKIWKIKGNDEEYNYSIYDFKGEKHASLSPSYLKQSPNIHVQNSSLDESHFFTDEFSPSHKSPNLSPLKPSLTQSNTTSIVSEIPALVLPKSLTLEIYTQNQLIKSHTILQSTQYITKVISTEAKLLEIKYIVIDEIILGIEKAFRLIDDDQSVGSSTSGVSSTVRLVNSPVRSGAFDTKQIDLLFSYFNYGMHAWRDLRSESDWITAKMVTCCGVHSNAVSGITEATMAANTIKLMYSLEKSSEFVLLKQIQQNYASRRQLMKNRKAQVSLEKLTERLAYPRASSPTNNSGHKYKSLPGTASSSVVSSHQLQLNSSASITNTSLLFDDSRPQSRQKSAMITSHVHATVYKGKPSSSMPNGQSKNTGPTVLQRSILYPRQNPVLTKLTEENRLLAEKQEKIAGVLENKILKTKW